MTIWTPNLTRSSSPLYARIVEQLQSAIDTGVLQIGSRLPTQRELAQRLGLTVVTVTRAYRAAAARGLIESTVGRGSFVRAARREAVSAGPIDLSTNVITGGELTLSRELCRRLQESLTPSYRFGSGLERHRAAGATFISQARPDGVAARIVVTAGAQHAMLVAFAALTKPGETVFVEEVTYHGMKGVAALLHLRLEALPLDRFGLLPGAFEKASRSGRGRILYTLPTLQNPTGVTMPEKRRVEIADIAAKHGVTVVEDDVYGFLNPSAPPAITSHHPQSGIFLTGVGKSLCPALRVGYLLAPEALLPRLHTALNATMLFASPLGAEIAASAIEDGTAAKVVEAKRKTIAERHRLAARILGVDGAPSPHLWLTLPRRWDAEAFSEESRRRDAPVAAGSTFAVREPAPNAVRVSLGAPASTPELEIGLQIIAALIDAKPSLGGASVV